MSALGARGLSASRIRQAYQLLGQIMAAAEINGIRHYLGPSARDADEKPPEDEE